MKSDLERVKSILSKSIVSLDIGEDEGHAFITLWNEKEEGLSLWFNPDGSFKELEGINEEEG